MSDLDLSVLRGIAEAARREGTLLHLSDGEWRDFQSIPDHGYSHRAWVDQKIIGRCDSLLSRLEAAGGYRYPGHQTPWQEIQRAFVGELETGAVLEPAVKYQRIAQTMGIPRDNH